MPIRGENVGTAYVRIVGDGSSLPGDIREGFRDAEPSVREAGEHHGNEYSDALAKRIRAGYERNFGKGNTQTNIFEGLNDQLTRSLARLELADRTFRSPKWKQFVDRLRDEGGAAGELLAQEIADEFRDSGNLDRLAASMESYGPRLRQAQARILKELEEEQRDHDRRTLEQGRLWLRARSEMLRDFAAREAAAERQTLERGRMVLQARAMMERDFAQRQDAIQRLGRMQDAAIAEDRRRTLTSLRTAMDNYVETLQRVERGERVSGGSRRIMIRDLTSIQTRARNAGIAMSDLGDHLDTIDLRTRRLHPSLLRFNGILDATADRTGRLFGRGSRSELLNFFGGLVSGALRVAFILPKLVSLGLNAVHTLANAGRAASQAFADAQAGAGGLMASLVSGGRAGAAALALNLETAGVAMIAFVAAAGAAILVIGPLVAGLSLLVGAVSALALTLGGAVIGAVAALVSLLAPLAFGIGGVALAIHGMNDELRDSVVKTFDPLIKRFEQLGQAAAEPLFADLEGQVNRLMPLLDELEPVMESAGRGMRLFFDEVIEGVTSRGFAYMLRSFDYLLPFALEKLGSITGNVFEGMAGVIRALQPLLFRFLGWLEDVTDDFAKFANSPEGQRKLKDFFEDVGDSAKSVGQFIEELTLLIGDMFDSGGNDAGKGIFDDMTEKLREIRQWFEDNPDALENWFSDAREFAQKLGKAIEGVGAVLDALDTPENRDAIITFFDLFYRLVTGIAREIRFLDAVLETIGTGIDVAVQEIQDALGKIGSGGGFNQGLIVSRFAGLGPRIIKAIGKVDVGGIIRGAGDAVANLVGAFSPAGERILRRIGKVSVTDIIVGAAVAVANMVRNFQGSGDRVLRTIGKVDVAGIITNAPVALARLVGSFNPAARMILGAIGNVNVEGIITGAFTAAENLVSAFRGLAGRIVDAIGTIVPRISLPNIPGLDRLTASGGVFDGAQWRIIAEAGREAVVPLDRPLSEVDPSVRMLSAIAQGLSVPSGGTAIAGPSKTINAPITVMTPTTDPRAVAAEVVDRLAAVGGY